MNLGYCLPGIAPQALDSYVEDFKEPKPQSKKLTQYLSEGSAGVFELGQRQEAS
jgi:hypothetical protein